MIYIYISNMSPQCSKPALSEGIRSTSIFVALTEAAWARDSQSVGVLAFMPRREVQSD